MGAVGAVVGPLQWEPPGERVDPPPGRGPVVLVAPSTSQDPEHRLLRAALEGLADAPVRVIATSNGREPPNADPVPDNAVLVPMAVVREDDAAVRRRRAPRRPRDARARAGHRLLGRRVPAGGDMNENAARVDWAGLGVRIRRAGSARGRCSWRCGAPCGRRRARGGSPLGGTTTARRARPRSSAKAWAERAP